MRFKQETIKNHHLLRSGRMMTTFAKNGKDKREPHPVLPPWEQIDIKIEPGEELSDGEAKKIEKEWNKKIIKKLKKGGHYIEILNKTTDFCLWISCISKDDLH